MISGRSDGIAAESGLLFPFAMNLSDLSCSGVFHINYTRDARGETQRRVRLSIRETGMTSIRLSGAKDATLCWVFCLIL